MAWSGPAVTKAVAEANGFNDLVLSDPADQGPYRTDAQAVTDGSLVSGRTVHYGVWRTTTTGDAEFEEGHGVYTKSGATRTIARTAGNVLDGSNGPGVLVDFGLSGQMDVLFYPVLDGSNIPSPAEFATNLGLPQLAAANLFTASQVISTTSQTDLELQTVTNGRRVGFRLTSGLEELAVRYFAAGVDPLTFGSGGTVITVGATTTLQKASGNKYDAFPVGTPLTFHAAPPLPYVRQDVAGERVVKLATSADTVGATGGSWTVSGLSASTTVNAHGITSAEAPTHSITTQGTDAVAGASLSLVTNVSHNVTGTPHTHTATTTISSTGAWRPAFQIACIGVKT